MIIELLAEWDELCLLPVLAVGVHTCDEASCGCRHWYVTAGWGFWHITATWPVSV